MGIISTQMDLIKNDPYRKYKVLGGLVLFLLSLFIFTDTMAPTTSFWDCGEFIACSYTLGVPHPPGTPLFVLIGRFFTLIEFFKEVAIQVNFLSALSSALSVLLMYLLIARSLERWVKGAVVTRTSVIVGGSFGGGLAMTLSDTFWFNAVEAEVYAMSILIMLLCCWLTLIWMDSHERKGSERLLIMMMYILFLSPGIHIQAMAVIPPILLLVIMTDEKLRFHWKPYVIGFGLSMVVYAVTDFIFLVYVMAIVLYLKIILSGKGFSTWFTLFGALIFLFTGYKLFSFVSLSVFLSATTIGFLLIFTLLTFVLKERERYNTRFWFWIVFVALIGYAPQAYIPIRSALNPNIDENDPQEWSSFQGFLERKQYGQDSMLESMLKRRTTWKEQFGVNPHCGLWGFFRQQYVRHIEGRPLFGQWYWIPILIIAFGLWMQWKGDRKTALFFTSHFFLGTIGILVVFNFKQHEVRIRDYFYTPGFVFASYWVGIGLAAVIDHVRKLVASQTQNIRRAVVLATAGLMILLPALPVLATMHYDDERDVYFIHDRSGNYIPWDYAYNLLQSVAPDGVIFTNGDNDTFPLWFLQEVVGVRRDVRIANLSLLNTPWYIKQLRDLEPKIPIRFDDDFIEKKLVPQRIPKAGVIKVGGIPIELKKGQIFRVQDWMIIEIINAIKWSRPVFFAVTVSNNNKLGLDPYLKMEGMAFRLYPEKVDSRLDEEKTRHNLYEVYQYRGLTDPTVYKNPNTYKLISNYNAAYFQLALKYHNELGRSPEAIQVLARADSLVGIGWRGYYLMSQIYSKMGKDTEAIENLEKVLAERPREVGVHMNLGGLYQKMKQTDKAVAAYERVLAIKPNVAQAYQALERIHYSRKDFPKLEALVSRWTDINPKDKNAQARLAGYRRQLQAQAKAPKPPADSAAAK